MTNEEKSERLLEAATEILVASPGRSLNVVALNKALFYLDLVALRDTGAPITHNTYLALGWGPVVAKYPTRLVGELEKRGYARQVTNTDALAKPVQLIREPEVRRYVPPELRARVAEIAMWSSARTSTALSDISHDNPGWRLAYEQGVKLGGKPEPIDMLVAMQQIVASDPWLDEALTDTERTQAVSADSEEGTGW